MTSPADPKDPMPELTCPLCEQQISTEDVHSLFDHMAKDHPDHLAKRMEAIAYDAGLSG